MIINATFAPIDRQFNSVIPGHAGVEILLTLGAGSYIDDCDVNLWAENINSPHILIGRFNSWANRISVFIGGNHSTRNVTSFPFDVQRIIGDVFGRDNPQIKPLPYKRPNRFQVVVGHDVWIGRGVTIFGGVKIGNGAVIGAKAVVAKDIPPYAIAVGNPARVIKYRFDTETIKKFLAVKWWNWDLKKIADNLPLMTDVEKFLKAHYSPELDTFPEDDISRQLNRVGGVVITLSPTFGRKSRCGLRSCANSPNRTSKTNCLSYGSIKTRRIKILTCRQLI